MENEEIKQILTDVLTRRIKTLTGRRNYYCSRSRWRPKDRKEYDIELDKLKEVKKIVEEKFQDQEVVLVFPRRRES